MSDPKMKLNALTEDEFNAAFNEWGSNEIGSDHRLGYLQEILLGQYSLEEARRDVLSFAKPGR